MATWIFHITDNGGKHHNLTIRATNKDEAIRKGFEKSRKKAAGDLSLHWDCKLLRA